MCVTAFFCTTASYLMPVPHSVARALFCTVRLVLALRDLCFHYPRRPLVGLDGLFSLDLQTDPFTNAKMLCFPLQSRAFRCSPINASSHRYRTRTVSPHIVFLQVSTCACG